MTKSVCTRGLLLVLLAYAAPAAAFAQTAYLEQSAVVGEGETIFISRLPVAAANGKIGYWDGTINLTVNTAGVPSVAASQPSFLLSAKLVADHFKNDRYYVKNGGCATQIADVKSGVGAGGSTVWSLVLETAASCGGAYPNQAMWQTGTPAPDVAARLSAAKVPNNPNYSYGLTDVGGGCYGPFCRSNGLIAAEQISDDTTLISYTDFNGNDYSGQIGSITFILCADKSCSNAPM